MKKIKTNFKGLYVFKGKTFFDKRGFLREILRHNLLKSNNIDIIIVFAYEYFKEIKEITKNYNCEYFQPIPFRKLS